jgi:arabinose-5-phosphate isomerase
MDMVLDQTTLAVPGPRREEPREAGSFRQFVELLKLEADSISQCAERLCPDQVETAVGLLAACRGKIVLSGVGKSGFIARKVGAMMNCTGTVAVYLHPSDALHGDIGVVSPDDVVVAFSNSGETEELLALLPHFRRRGVPLIAVVGNLRSTMARAAAVALDAYVGQEACPFNLTPTASAIVALALGDALAVSLMQRKGVTREDFASNHPLGQLGKRLTTRVQDLMRGEPRHLAVAADTSWVDVMSAIANGGVGAVSVSDEAGRVAGVVTDGDLRRSMRIHGASELCSLTAEDVMTRDPITVSLGLPVYDALRLIEERGFQFSTLPVVDEQQRCAGFVRLDDIIRSGL